MYTKILNNKILQETTDYLLVGSVNGRTFKISIVDRYLLKKYWSVSKRGMVYRQEGTSPNKITIYLHCNILNFPEHFIEHKNLDLTDNQRWNLKIHTENWKDTKTLYGFLKTLLHNSKLTANRRMISGRLEAGIHSISFTDIMNLWDKQNGLCYYSKLPMNHEPHSDWNVSLERLDPTKGYIISNTVLCTQEFNGASQWNLEKIKSIPNILNNTPLSIDINEKITTIRRVRKNTLYGWLQSRLELAKGRGRIFSITYTDLCDIFIKQNGRCAYSNIPFKLPTDENDDWKLSIERIDIAGDYTKNNILLICFEFNTSNKSGIAYKTHGNSGWTREKFICFYKKLKENV